MALFPTAQKKLQEEVDRVVGSNRLPAVSDEENMPYVRCCIKEILRCMWKLCQFLHVANFNRDAD